MYPKKWKLCLIYDSTYHPRPLTYEQRTGHILPLDMNPLQWYIRDIEAFSASNNMQLKKQKTKAMMFTRAKKRAFPLEITFQDASLPMLGQLNILD